MIQDYLRIKPQRPFFLVIYDIQSNNIIVGFKLYQNFIPFFENSVDPDQLASDEAR